MSAQRTRQNFAQRYLDPASRLGEVLFGLIMVLGATLTAGLTAEDGEKGARQLLKAAIGCNVAWGIIDGVMYVMNCVTVRSGRARLFQAVQKAPGSQAALDAIRDELGPGLEPLAGPRDREALYQAVQEHLRHAKPARVSMTREDFYGALACCWLVMVSCLPAALPFLVFKHQPVFALRVSNALLIAMLFLVGYKWAHFTNANRWAAGLTMVAIGLMLVGLAAMLGG